MVYLLEHLFRVVWHEEVVPKEWREGLIVNWGEPERAPPRALQRLRSLSHNDNNGGGGISYVLLNAHARSLRGEFEGQSRQESRQAEVSLRF